MVEPRGENVVTRLNLSVPSLVLALAGVGVGVVVGACCRLRQLSALIRGTRQNASIRVPALKAAPSQYPNTLDGLSFEDAQ
jgi:hypothetical protein